MVLAWLVGAVLSSCVPGGASSCPGAGLDGADLPRPARRQMAWETLPIPRPDPRPPLARRPCTQECPSRHRVGLCVPCLPRDRPCRRTPPTGPRRAPPGSPAPSRTSRTGHPQAPLQGFLGVRQSRSALPRLVLDPCLRVPNEVVDLCTLAILLDGALKAGPLDQQFPLPDAQAGIEHARYDAAQSGSVRPSCLRIVDVR